MKNNDIDLYEFSDKIENFNDFLVFLELLKADHDTNISEWHNNDLLSYLGALHGFTSDTKSVNDVPSWKIFARLLLGAIVYE